MDGWMHAWMHGCMHGCMDGHEQRGIGRLVELERVCGFRRLNQNVFLGQNVRLKAVIEITLPLLF